MVIGTLLLRWGTRVMDVLYFILFFVGLFGLLFSIYVLKCVHRMGKIHQPQTCSSNCSYEVVSEVRGEWERYWRYVLTGERV